MENVTEDSVTKAMNYLAKTDAEHARMRAEVNALDDLKKSVVGLEFESQSGAVEARKAAAYASEAYQAHIKKKQTAELAFFELDNKRKRAILTIDVWRSLNANRRQGNV